ncbi:MAG: NAD(P)H-hydrate epimerase [Pirellulales bacterium]|nr:NAD(P)H-hydrate epimerase [Pirellulales bacterium]
MILPPLSRDQVRGVDQTAMTEYGISGLVLMENAGRGAAEIIARISPPGQVAILCGRGNNGGDGYVIARHLQLLGRDVKIISLVKLETLSGDAAENAKIVQRAEIECWVLNRPQDVNDHLSRAAVIVECLLGTGATGAPRGVFADAIRLANQTPAMRIAIDIPAGLDCDSGVAHEPTLTADHTISFVAPKLGFTLAQGPDHVGKCHIVGIGVPQSLLDQVARCEAK